MRLSDKESKNYTGRHLHRSIIIISALVVWLTCIFMGIITTVRSRMDSINLLQSNAAYILDLMVRNIDTEDLAKCMATGEKSEKYNRLQKLADDIKETHDLEYLYIIKPLKQDPPDNMMDVLAATTAYERKYEYDLMTDLGQLTGDMYPAEVAEKYLARMDSDPKVTFFRNDTDYGRVITSIRPILDKDGEPIAVICADIGVDGIIKKSVSNVLYSLLAAFIISAIMLLVLYKWLDIKVVSPMTEDIQSYARDLSSAESQLSTMKDKMLTKDIIAYRDGLTGAGNKAAYLKMTEALDGDILVDEAEFSVVMIDLNYLKVVNDEYGHDKGDKYIQKMYDMICSVFADSPVFRVGGDELVVITEGEENKKCEDLIQELRRRMDETAKADLPRWEVISAAVGCSSFNPQTDICTEDVFRRADNLMYENKKAMHAIRK